jgi:hypothetical protein
LFQEYEEPHLAIFTTTYKVRNLHYSEESVVIGRVTNKRNKMFHYNENSLIERSVPCKKNSFFMSSEDTSISPRK